MINSLVSIISILFLVLALGGCASKAKQVDMENIGMEKKLKEDPETIGMIFFSTGDSEVHERFIYTLRNAIDAAKANPHVIISLVGHSDARGDTPLNYKLSEDRAVSVRGKLMNMGLESHRIEINSIGNAIPLDPGQGHSPWARNRRVDIRIKY